MKKKQIFLKTIVAITLLSAMLVSAFLGTSNAEYFKSFNKTLSLEMKPDLNLSYYLKDATDITSEGSKFTYNPRFGTYGKTDNFSQTIKVGRDSSTLTPTAAGNIYASAEWKNNVNDKFNGKNIIYQIRIPVDETGYYSLDFAVDFTMGSNGQGTDVFTQNYDRAIGCEILTHKDLSDGGFSFGGNKRLDLYERSGNDAIYVTSNNTTTAEAAKQGVKRFSDLVGHRYQWKTLAPTRQEYVSLAFKVEADDVKNGYVLWMWDFEGLYGSHSYLLEFTDVSVEKIMNLDGTTDTRSSNTPYFMFPETSQVNNQLVRSIGTGTEASYPTSYSHDTFTYDTEEGYTVRGMNDRGKVSYSKGRGAFVTEATTNSLQLQAESIAYGYSDNLDHVAYSNYSGTFANPLAFYVPVKNVKPGVTYKVTFDFSIARQGTYQYSGYSSAGTTSAFDRNDMTNATLADYATYSNMFKSGTNVFSSYLYAGVLGSVDTPPTNRSTQDHQKKGMTAISYNNKAYNGAYLYKDVNGNEQTGYASLTKYDDLTSSTYYNMNEITSTSVNDTYSITQITQSDGGRDRTASRNWYNAIRNVEYNGQNKINWLTFYNTTFSFNIDDAKSMGLQIDDKGYITNLEWAWAIDSVIPMSYYRIRLDNVRIQEVVEYSSSLDRNGVIISGYKLTTDYVDNNHTDLETDDVDKHGTDDQSEWTWYKGLFVSYRGTNGTGQNFQSKGAVLDRNTKPQNSQIFTTEGNIYAPIVDAKKINVAVDGADAYKIMISGYAVCKGGIDRYVFSIDGGKTWHDMTLEGIDTDARNASNDLSKAERGVNQYSSGQTSYYKDGTHDNKNEFDWGTDDKYRPTYEECTHIEFTAEDAANGNFHGIVNSRDQDPDPDMGWSLVADLSEFKHQANLDIIIAAVPESNHDLRCEIVRIINYNQIRNYRTYADHIVSDISVTSNGVISELSAVHNATGNYDHENKESFTIGKGIRPNGLVGAGGGYALRMSNSYDYEDIRTLYSDFPVKKTLKVLGYALVEGDVDSYWWSADGGKNWNPCPEVAVDATGDQEKTITQQREWWFDGGTEFDKNISSHFEPNYDETNNKFTGGITADLSSYEGEVVDVIFCAKPKNSDVYVPIARIDNVAVYGEQGTFYTRVHRVIIDGRTNENLSGDVNVEEIEQTHSYNSNDYLNFRSKWNIDFSEKAYVIFEPQNVNAVNAKYITNVVQEIESAGRVTIDGYIMCKGGVSRYKFSLDGGETWTVINDNVDNMPSTHSMVDNSKISDSSFDSTKDGVNGNFCCTDNSSINHKDPDDDDRKSFYEKCLEFNIPALPQGAERDLLVVAENDPDGNPATDDGKEFPVLHIKIKVKNTKFGYQNITRNADLTKLNVQAGHYTTNNELTFNPEITDKATGEQKTLNRITIPVTETGEHTLSFGHIIHNDPSIDSKTNKQLYNSSDGENNTGKNSAGNTANTKANITLKANKTHYLEGEGITVSVDMSKTTDSNPGILKVVVVSEDWLNQYGNQHAIYAETITMDWKYNSTTKKWSASWSIDNIRSLAYANLGLQSDVQALNAGKYKIMLLNRVGGDYGIKVPGKDANMTVRDFLHYKDLREKFLLAEIPIYIHAADEKVDFSLVHDEGEYTYFSDVSRQLVDGDPNVADIETLTAAQVFGNTGTQTNSLSLDIDVTEGDVRRGYIILDTNYTGLWAGNNHTHAECTKPTSEGGHGTNWGTHEYDPNCNVAAHKHAEDKYYKYHTHTDNRCLSRNSGNDSHFDKQIKGENLYELTKLYYGDDANSATIIKHTGIDYKVTFNLGGTAFVKKT